MLTLLLQSMVNGIVLGSMVALASLGLTLIWSVEGFPNIAHGDFLTLAAYLTFTLNVLLAYPFGIAAVLGSIIATGIVLILYRIAFRPLRRSPLVALFGASIGVALALRGMIGLLWGTEYHSFALPVMRDLSLATIRINPVDLAVVGAAMILMALLYLLLYGTRIGAEMRAVADVPELARVSGINSEWVVQASWLVAGLVTASAGILLGAKIDVDPLLGWNLLLAMFAATTLGGVGSLPGAVVGGIVIGIIMEVSTVWISPTYKVGVAFVALVIVLLVRPRGLFAK
jgi:branched-subunit amino acid ABC-type transport system permease component